jgi:nucleotide-binding universal stress UspA family protein
LAARVDAKITLLHAYEIPVFGFPDGSLIATADIAARITQAAEKALADAATSRKGRGVPIETVLRTGVAWEEVNTVAQEKKADLVVIGTHGRRGLARAILGSVAENIIRTATVPVLTIHGPRE